MFVCGVCAYAIEKVGRFFYVWLTCCFFLLREIELAAIEIT